MGAVSAEPASTPTGAVFLSYASQDSGAAQRICAALRSAGIEVWFDQSELRGGDAWDRQIRRQIHDCRLFIAVISAHTETRDEGYFRREWRLAVERAGDMAEDKAFVVPVAIDGTGERGARVPDSFKHVQWTRLPGGEPPPAFVERVRRLLSPDTSPARAPTPGGSTTVPVSPIPLRQSWRSKAGLWGIGAVLAVALSYFVVDRFWLSKRTAAATAGAAPASAIALQKSIAVLPFVDLSEKHNQEYFSDGLTEELIDHLARNQAMRVTSRTSAFYFKGKQLPAEEIGRLLKVNYLLEGSVRSSGTELRISTQLIQTANDAHVWSQTYNQHLSDIFQVQDDIATAVATALRVALDTRAGTKIRGTPNVDAYTAQLEGRFYYQRGNSGDEELAIKAYRRALDNMA